MASTSNLENDVVAGVGVIDVAGVAGVVGVVGVAGGQGDGVPSSEVNKIEDNTATEPATTIEAEERTFTLFRKLAAEFRLKIWKFALPTEPRYIEVHSVHPNFDPDPAAWTYHYTHKPVISPLLLVNREAHAVAIAQGERGVRLEASPPGPAAVYYDPDIDVLCFRADREDGTYEYWKWFNDMGDEFMGRVKHMAMQCSFMYVGTQFDFSPNQYDFSPDDYFSQAHMNKLVGLETLQVARFTERDIFDYVDVDGVQVCQRDRGKIIVGFVEDEKVTRSSKFKEHYRFAMTHIGQDWDEDPIEPVRAGWVLPRAVFGDFITEG